MICRRCEGTGREPVHGGTCFGCFLLLCRRCGRQVPRAKLREEWIAGTWKMVCVDWLCDKRKVKVKS